MTITKDGEIYCDDDVVQLDCAMAIQERFAVNVFKEHLFCGKEEFVEFPSEAQILYCIKKFKGDSANIVKVYRPIKVFAD